MTLRPRVPLLAAALALLTSLLSSVLVLVPSIPPATAQAAASAAPLPSCDAAGFTVQPLGGPLFYLTDTNERSAYTGYRVTNATGIRHDDLYASLGAFTGGSVGLAAQQPAEVRIGDLAAGAGQSSFWYLTAAAETLTAQQHVLTVYRHHPALPTAVPLCTTTGGFSAVETTLDAAANKVTGVSVGGGTPRLGSTFTVTVTGETGTIGDGPAGDYQSFWMSAAVSQVWPAGSFRLLSTSISMSADGARNSPVQTWHDRLRLSGLGQAGRDYTATYTFRAVGFTSGPAAIRPVQQIASGTQIKHTATPSGAIPAITPPTNDLAMTVTASPDRLPTGGGEAAYQARVTGTAGAELDGFAITLPEDAQIVPGSTTWAGRPVGDPVPVADEWRASGPFTVPAGGGVLAFRLAHGPADGPRTTKVQGLLGGSRIGTSPAVVDGSNPATGTVLVNRHPVAHVLTKAVGDDATLRVPVSALGHDPDGDVLTLASVALGPDAAAQTTATISDGALAYAGAPDEDGDVVTFELSDGHGGGATGTATVLPAGATVPAASQTITVTPPSDLLVDATTSLGAQATSGLPVAAESRTPLTCSVTETGTVTGVAAGPCQVALSQAGDETWAPAPTLVVDLVVRRWEQTVSGHLPGSTRRGDSVDLAPTATSRLPVAVAVLTPDVCSTTAAGVVTALAAGTCRVRLTQAGDARYGPAEPVDLSFEVLEPLTEPPVVPPVDPPVVPPVDSPKKPRTEQRITLSAPGQTLAGPGSVGVSASSTSGLPVDVRLVSGPCSLQAGALTVADVGACVLEATQPGDELVEPAAAVRAVVDVVLPQDDVLTVPAGTQQAVPVPVLGNDPAGLVVDTVGAAQHGVASRDGAAVAYLPAIGHRGEDSFTYSVRDPNGRTATATVRVTVSNAAPTIADAAVDQVAGSERAVTLTADDANRDPLTLTARSADGRLAVSVEGRRLVLRARSSLSGVVPVRVRVEDGAGGVATAVVRDTVSPLPVRDATRHVSASGTRIGWTRSPADDATYEVLADGRVVCRTRELRCELDRIMGPTIDVTVRVRGADDTRSETTPAVPTGDGRVLMATVYFEPGQDELTRGQQRSLRRVADRILRIGFKTADLEGYTDGDGSAAYNLALSRRRTRTIAELLGGRDIRSSQAWFGMRDPVADNETPEGKAANRRVEVFVGF